MNPKGLLTMSQQELTRCDVIKRVCNKELKQSKAAKILDVSIRQIKRLCRRYQQEGASGMISKKRGKISNNRLQEKTKQKIIQLAKEHYQDFGPTFMSEKLFETHKIKISKESLRTLLVEANIWKTKKEKIKKIHQQRARRACIGELVQIDGSPHNWFEGRGTKCCLIVFIDDATSEILSLRFEPVETTQAYFRGLYDVIQKYGIPLAFYSDKHSIFRVNIGDDPCAQTQFGRACEQLGIELINAESAPAKGRVERANQTQQDRLVKELRLANICDIEAANRFLEGYRIKHNQRFAKTPREPQKAFITNTLSDDSLRHILSEQETRKVTKNLEVRFENKFYQIKNEGKGRRLQQAMVTVCRTISNEIVLLYREKRLDYTVFEPDQKRPILADEKSINALCDKKLQLPKPNKPKASHPWKCIPISKNSAMIQAQFCNAD